MSRAASRVTAALLVLGLVGCSDPTGTASRDGQADADRPTHTSAPGAGEPSGSSGGGGGAGGDESREPADAGDEKPLAGGDGGREGDSAGGARISLDSARSFIEDATDDAYGEIAPPYAEIVSASITGKGDVAEIVIEVEGEIPEKVGERDNLLVGVGIEYRGKMGGIAVMVQGTRDGWTPGIIRDGDQQELEDGWRTDGNRFVWTIPWDDLGGPRRFRWGASLRWFQFNSADSTEADQAQDRVPDSEPAAYPSAG